MENHDAEWRKGLLNGLAAHVMWGGMPLYFHLLNSLRADELLAYRICWTSIIVVVLLSARRAWPIVYETIADRRVMGLLLCSALLLGLNWLVFMHGVITDRVRFASLGYFVNPLVNVLLGMVFFRERLRGGQWCALGLATLGLGYLVWSMGELPWITLTLAWSFGLYGLVRKLIPIDSLVVVGVESFILMGPAFAYVIFGLGFPSLLGPGDTQTNLLVMLSGLITIGPLLCFGIAARRLPLSVLGFLQYVGPTLQLLAGVLILGERLTPGLVVCFACTWLALVVLTAEALHHQRQTRLAEEAALEATEPVS